MESRRRTSREAKRRHLYPEDSGGSGPPCRWDKLPFWPHDKRTNYPHTPAYPRSVVPHPFVPEAPLAFPSEERIETYCFVGGSFPRAKRRRRINPLHQVSSRSLSNFRRRFRNIGRSLHPPRRALRQCEQPHRSSTGRFLRKLSSPRDIF